MWGRRLFPVLVSLGAALAPCAASAAPRCGLSDATILGDLADLPRQEAHAAALRFDPLYRVWLDDGGLSWLDGDVDAARAASREACFTPQDVDGHATFELRAESEHFALFRQSGSPPQQGTVDGVLESLEDALATLTAQGWRRPAGIDDQQMMIFVEPLPAGLGGYTWVADCPGVGDGTMDWIVLSEEWASEAVLRDPLVAHELFHAVQRRYTYAEHVLGWNDSSSQWWLEASAVYQEGLVFPEELDLAEVRSAYWGEEPWKSLFLFDDVAGRHYQVFVFPLSVEASLDDVGWHREFWEQLDGQVGFDLRVELDTYLAPRGTGFDVEFGAYMARASEMDLPRYDYLLGPRDLQAFYGIQGGLAARYAATELPVSGAQEAGGIEGPMSLGGNYVWFGTTAASEERALELRFEGDLTTPGGDPVLWGLEVVAARADAIPLRAHVDPVVVTRKGVEVATATVLVHGIKEHLDGVWLIATRLDASGGDAPGWRWEGRLVRGDAALSIVPGATGCGCGAGTGQSPFLVLSSLLPLAVLRRRRADLHRRGSVRP